MMTVPLGGIEPYTQDTMFFFNCLINVDLHRMYAFD